MEILLEQFELTICQSCDQAASPTIQSLKSPTVQSLKSTVQSSNTEKRTVSESANKLTEQLNLLLQSCCLKHIVSSWWHFWTESYEPNRVSSMWGIKNIRNSLFAVESSVTFQNCWKRISNSTLIKTKARSMKLVQRNKRNEIGGWDDALVRFHISFIIAICFLIFSKNSCHVRLHGTIKYVMQPTLFRVTHSKKKMFVSKILFVPPCNYSVRP